MGKIKVGDIVKHKTAVDFFRNGQPARVVEVGNAKFDVVAEIIDGPNSGVRGYGPYENWELIKPANDELAELRAFKEAAIARFPELGVKVDPDFAEAKNLMQESEWSSGTECKTPDDPDFEGSVCDVVLKAIKRGRELERYAQGLTTPKD